MKQLTKEQKTAIYKRALQMAKDSKAGKEIEYFYKKEKKSDYFFGMCWYLFIATKELYPTVLRIKYDNDWESLILPIDWIHTHFPEIKKYEPAEHGNYWWNMFDYQKRIDVFTSIINNNEII